MNIIRFIIHFKFDAVALTVLAQNNSENYTSMDGLSHNTVYEIIQGKYGFMWMGTENGLCYFDGQDFHSIQSALKTKLPSLFITALKFDGDNGIWVGTTRGLRLINQQKATVETPILELAQKNISDIIMLPNQGLLVAVNGAGLYLIDAEHHIRQHWYHGSTTTPLPSNFIEKIFVSKKMDTLWVGTKDMGVSLIHLSDHSVTTFPIGTEINQLPSAFISSFTQDHAGNIWIGSKKGLLKYEIATQRIRPIYTEMFSTTSILSLYTDSNDHIWVGTELNGLWKINEKENGWPEQIQISDKTTSIRSIFEDHQQNIWIGSQRNGVFLLKDQFHSFKLLGEKELQSHMIWGILYDDQTQSIWAGTDGKGLTAYHLKNKTAKTYLHQPSNPFSLSDNNVLCAFKDDRNRFWFGTYNGGVNLYLPQKDAFQRINMSNGLLKNDIRSFGQDQYGTIWIGTNRGGLHYYDEKQKKAIPI